MKQSQEQSLTLEQQRVSLIGEYLYKFAAIANRDLGKSGEVVTIFAEALSDLTPKELERGLKEYLNEGKGFPWPSEIRELSEL